MKDTPDTAAPRGESVSVLSGDRICTQCGYNLVGQTVVREPHHGLLIVRCPECATVASVHEYPRLGAWGARWATLLATLWFIFLLAAWVGSAAITFSFSFAAGEDASRAYAEHLRQLFEAEQPQAGNPPTASLPPYVASAPPAVQQTYIRNLRMATGFEAWWRAQDRAAVLAAAGGRWGAFDRRALWFVLPATLAGFTLGWFWSIALLPIRRPWVLTWALAVVGLALVFSLTLIMDWRGNAFIQPTFAARTQIGLWAVLLILAYALIPLALGLLAGRPLTRRLARALLPPRLCSGLALLWTAEGLPPPRVS